jgi:hypothetical protein
MNELEKELFVLSGLSVAWTRTTASISRSEEER